MRSFAYLVALLGALPACTARTGSAPTATVSLEPPPPSAAWRGTANAADAAILDTMPQLWATTLAAAQPARAAIAGEGALLDPAAALDHPALPPGSYNCRVVRIEGRRLRSFAAQFCFVGGESDGRLSFNKQTGSDLPNGWLFPDEHNRYIFLGAQRRAPDDNALAYGSERARDLAGVVERVGPFRWRLVLPRRSPDALWVYELTPVPTERQPG